MRGKPEVPEKSREADRSGKAESIKPSISPDVFSGEAVKKRDWSAYQKEYWQAYKKRKKRVRGILSKEEYTEIEAVAKKSGRSVWEQIWHESESYRKSEHLLSKESESKLDQIYMVLRGIGNNVNQMARHSNRFRRMISERGVMKKLAELEEAVETFVRKPKGKE